MTADDQDAGSSTLLIVERARRGDEEAAGQLLERALPLVRRWAHGRLPPRVQPDANTEDVVQDAAIKVFRHLPRFTHEHARSLRTYLWRAVVNRIRDLTRSSQRQPARTEMPLNLGARQPSPLELAMREEQHDRFLNALRTLSATDRQLLIFRAELGYSAAEIGNHLGISATAAGMRLTRAFKKLQAALDQPSPS